MWRRVLRFAVMAASVVSAACHGFLAEPASRNAVHNSNYCPHCLAAGGPGVTYANGRVWPNSKHGVCGDPHTGPLDHEAGGKFATAKITGTYRRGQRITLRIKLTAPHGGRFSFGLCPVPDGASAADERRAVTQSCLDANRLTNAKDGTEFWWLGKKGVGEYTMDFVLPASVSCKRCVLQWHYETGNSCTIPGTPDQHVISANMVSCAQSGNMEEFWNCADVSISRDGGNNGTTRAPKPKRQTKRPMRIETFVTGPGAADHDTPVLVVGAAAAAAAAAMILPPLPLLLLVAVVAATVAWLLYTGAPRRRGFAGSHSKSIFSKLHYA